MRWRIEHDEQADQEIVERPISECSCLIIDDMVGDLGLSYLNDVAVWFANQNIRSGYRIKIEGHCFKGPYAIAWDAIRIAFEEDGCPYGLAEHLSEIWGPQNADLLESDEPRLERIA